MQNLEKANVDTCHIAVREDIESGISIVQVDDGGNSSILVIPGANATVDKAYIDQNLEVLKQCDLVLLQMEIPVETVLYVAKIKSMGKTVVLDPAPVPSCMPSELFHYVDFIKPNENELRMLTGANDIEVGMRNLLLYGVGCVIVTVGKEGAKVLDRIEGSLVTYPTPDVPIVDTTAAGDSFVAAFATAYRKDKDIANAVEYANKVGAFVVTRKGAQSSIPNQEEMERFCKELGLSK